MEAYYPSTGTTTFTDANNYGIAFTLPTGYTPVWSWVCSEGFCGTVHSNHIDSSKIYVWTICNCTGKTGKLKASVLCVKTHILG